MKEDIHLARLLNVSVLDTIKPENLVKPCTCTVAHRSERCRVIGGRFSPAGPARRGSCEAMLCFEVDALPLPIKIFLHGGCDD